VWVFGKQSDRVMREVVDMEAYTFTAVPKNGIIILPKKNNSPFVEVTVREIKNPAQRKRDLLSPIVINTSGAKWTREEANERR